MSTPLRPEAPKAVVDPAAQPVLQQQTSAVTPTPAGPRASSDMFGATFGGGEANVAVSLALFGLESYYVTRLPKHDIGEAAGLFLQRGRCCRGLSDKLDLTRHVYDDQILLGHRLQWIGYEVEIFEQKFETVYEATVWTKVHLFQYIFKGDKFLDVEVRLIHKFLGSRIKVDIET